MGKKIYVIHYVNLQILKDVPKICKPNESIVFLNIQYSYIL